MSASCSELRWVSHSLRQEAPAKTAALIVALCGFSAGVWWSLGPGYAIIALVVLVGAVSRYLLPVHYRLTDREVSVTLAGLTRRTPWDRFRSYTVHPDGVFLRPFLKPSRLDSHRGCFLRFCRNGEEVLAVVRSAIPGGKD